jgi:hypothetical protein
MAKGTQPEHANSGLTLAWVRAYSGRTAKMSMNETESRDLIAAA